MLRPGRNMLYTRPPRPGAAQANERSGLMNAVLWLVDTVIDLYITVLIIFVILSWLISFNVVNTRNRFVYLVGDVLYRITEPALRPIRRMVPNLGGIDISPMVLILGLWFVQVLIRRDIAPLLS